MELHQESNQREQSCHSHWNSDWGSWNKTSGRWQSAGDERADGDEYNGHVDGVVIVEEPDQVTVLIQGWWRLAYMRLDSYMSVPTGKF